MGRKIWRWVIAGLAILLALAVTAAIWISMRNRQSQPPQEDPSQSQQQEDTQDRKDPVQVPTDGSQEQTQDTQPQDTQPQDTEPQDTEPQEQPGENTEPSLDWQPGEDQLPPF